jgi:hypothetical protein
MASVVEIPCPNCEKPLKVPESVFGKKIKCKYCSHPFVVNDPNAEDEKPARGKPAVKPSKPGGQSVKAKKEKVEPKKEEPKKEEPKPAGTYKFEEEEDEGANPNPLGVVDEGQDIPRCPHCAKELDPPDAKVCIHCGFNNVTRTRAESKRVWEPDSADWINHLGPGIAAVIICIVLLVLVIVCWVNMRDWMTDSFLEKEEVGTDGEKAFFVKPGAFITFAIAAAILPFVACLRFAIKRLAFDYRPTERVKT